MKKPPFFQVTMLLLLLSSLTSVSQRTAQLPEPTELAGVKIKLNEDTRRILSSEITAISQNRITLNAKLERAALYFPIIESLLDEESIPEDFKYLPLLESGLNANSVSTNRGLGFWQLRQAIAIDGGLRMDATMDERKNLHASTHAAALYLNKLNGTFNNWLASLQLYRLGSKEATRLVPANWSGNKEITLTGTNSLYILKILALKTVFEKERKSFKLSGNQFFEYQYSAGKSIAKIASELGIAEDDIRRYNSWLVAEALPQDKKYVMLIPANEQVIQLFREKALAGNNKISTKVEEIGFPVLKKVQAKNDLKPYIYEINGRQGIQALLGDDFETLANRADISVRKILKFNDLDKNDQVIPNEIYYTQRKPKKAPVPFHTVLEGQTLWSISQMYGLQLSRLLKYNRLAKEQRLQTGRVMWMARVRPEETPVEIIQFPTISEHKMLSLANIHTNEATEKPLEIDMLVTSDNKVSGLKMFENEEPEAIKRIDTRKPFVHTVVPGQSLYGIARQYGITIDDLQAWNKIPEENKLKSGQKLLIKNSY